MKLVINNIQVIKCIFVLSVIYPAVLGGALCPEPEDIKPCTCTESISAILKCTGLVNTEVIGNVLQRSARYTFKEVHIMSSVFVYVPSEFVSNVLMEELYLTNMTMNALFDSPPHGLLALNKLEIDNTVITRSLTWESLTDLKNLRDLTVLNTLVKVLGTRFMENAPESLERLIFYNTEMRKISSGALKNLKNLDRFSVKACKLTQLSRDIFPTPFYGRFLYFDDNKISSIPDDLFTDMPRLQFLSLNNNLLSVVPQSAFGGRPESFLALRLEGNPLICDCELEWIVKDKPEIVEGNPSPCDFGLGWTVKGKPEIFGGTCTSPEQLAGRKLKDLVDTDFNC